MRGTTTAKCLAVQRGFSLLELLVAFAIMAMSLGLLYRAAGGSVRSVGDAERHVYAVALAESLLASYDAVPEGGLSSNGESAGLSWQVRSQPYPTDNKDPKLPLLHEVRVQVRWSGGTLRQLDLVTLLPQRSPLPGAVQR